MPVSSPGRLRRRVLLLPSIVLGPPVRHIHTHVGIVDLADVEASLRLLVELVKVLDKRTVESFTSIGGLNCGL
jgi:endoglucanase